MFQSTRPHGARHIYTETQVERTRVSIHAPARGATKEGNDTYRFTYCFNPRARTGRDLDISGFKRSGIMFQSTRPHGARRKQQYPISSFWGFNPRARTGRDDCYRALIRPI